MRSGCKKQKVPGEVHGCPASSFPPPPSPQALWLLRAPTRMVQLTNDLTALIGFACEATLWGMWSSID